MVRVVWGTPADKIHTGGVEKVLLYKKLSNGTYGEPRPWNGVVSITDTTKRIGGEARYYDGILVSSPIGHGPFSAEVSAFSHPYSLIGSFGEQLIGFATSNIGLYAEGQISPNDRFGLSYITRVYDGSSPTEKGFRLHLVYGVTLVAKPRSYETLDDDPEVDPMTWDLSTTTEGLDFGTWVQPTSKFVVDSTRIQYPQRLDNLIEVVHGPQAGSTVAQLPTPNEVRTILSTA